MSHFAAQRKKEKKTSSLSYGALEFKFSGSKSVSVTTHKLEDEDDSDEEYDSGSHYILEIKVPCCTFITSCAAGNASCYRLDQERTIP